MTPPTVSESCWPERYKKHKSVPYDKRKKEAERGHCIGAQCIKYTNRRRFIKKIILPVPEKYMYHTGQEKNKVSC